MAAANRATQEKAPVATKQARRRLHTSKQKWSSSRFANSRRRLAQRGRRNRRASQKGCVHPPLGTFEVRKLPERTARNRATGEPIAIKASRKVVFGPLKDLSEAIQSEQRPRSRRRTDLRRSRCSPDNQRMLCHCEKAPQHQNEDKLPPDLTDGQNGFMPYGRRRKQCRLQGRKSNACG